MALGDDLRTMRVVRRVTQTTVAEQTGIPVRTIRSYEYGEREPKPEAVARIKQVLNTFPVIADKPFGPKKLIDKTFEEQSKRPRLELSTPNAVMRWHGSDLRDDDAELIRAIAQTLYKQRKYK